MHRAQALARRSVFVVNEEHAPAELRSVIVAAFVRRNGVLEVVTEAERRLVCDDFGETLDIFGRDAFGEHAGEQRAVVAARSIVAWLLRNPIDPPWLMAHKSPDAAQEDIFR